MLFRSVPKSALNVTSVQACRQAVSRFPNEPRFQYQLARSLDAILTGPYFDDEAARLSLQALKAGHAWTRSELISNRCGNFGAATCKSIQLALIGAGLYRGNADGVYGAGTLSALQSWIDRKGG